MIAFIDDHRQAYGVEAICRSPADRPVDLPRPRRQARRSLPPAREGPPRRGSESRDPTRVRGELPRLWRAQGLAAIAAGGLLRRALYGGPADAEHGPSGAIRGKPLRTTIRDKTAPCPLDHVNREFQAPAPDRLWLADFTYVSTWAGFIYVAFVIDAYARRIVGWRASRTAHADFVLDALEQALHDRRPASRGGLVHHSDRGAQYVSIKYTERLAAAGIEPSVGSVGDSYDCESVGAAWRA